MSSERSRYLHFCGKYEFLTNWDTYVLSGIKGLIRYSRFHKAFLLLHVHYHRMANYTDLITCYVFLTNQ